MIHLRCPSCGATNRVPVEKLGGHAKAVCGRCKTPLPVASGPVPVTDATFGAEVEQSPLPVLLDLWAPWCGPCHMLAPTIDQLATELAGRLKVVKLNIDDNPMTASRYGVQSIPTLLVLEGGREIGRLVGVQPKEAILRRLEQAGVQTRAS
jgi:thioredoxin 2